MATRNKNARALAAIMAERGPVDAELRGEIPRRAMHAHKSGAVVPTLHYANHYWRIAKLWYEDWPEKVAPKKPRTKKAARKGGRVS